MAILQFHITDVGRAAGLDAENLDLHVSLSHIAVGSAKYNGATAANTKTALTNELARYPLNGGGVDATSHTLRFVVNIEATITADIFELGLYTNTGVLFAVAAVTGNSPLIQLVTNIVTIVTIGLTFVDVDFSNIQIVIDPNTPIAIALMNQHLAHQNPHPQYAKKLDFDNHVAQNTLEHNNLLALINTEIQARSLLFSALINATYHVGSWHGTNSPSYNPATALKPLFGYETTWYLWPYVPAGVANTSAALGQIIALENGSSTQAMTTRIWQRLPDGASPPTYVLTANQTTVDEGEQITFNLTTTGLAQGTPVAWNMTGIQTADISPNAMSGQFVVGADGTATKAITIVADQVTEGTEVLTFALTYIPNRFVNVTINDTSIVPEQIVTISSDSPGLNLRGLFNLAYGQPTSATKAVFIIESGVKVIADSVTGLAVYGDHWPDGSTREIRIMDGAIVAGRGGKGGDGGGDGNVGDPGSQQYPAQDGENGGTAIEAAPDSPIVINNYGLLAAGGGGAGAGGGAGKPDGSVRGIGSSPGGGGAPYGAAGVPRYSNYDVPAENQAKAATLNMGGQGGASYVEPNVAIWAAGGNGGNIGENGGNGGNAQSGSTVHLTPGQAGGLAGYIYQGPVTINNLGSGQTKGRTP